MALTIAVLAIIAIVIVLVVRPSTAVARGAAPVDDSWERVQAAGKIVVGTSADYPPFEFYTGDFQIDGFDIALMDEIGQRLGIQVEYHNFAFDGLGGALQLGQIDAAIAAISVTPEREAEVDFSNVYFVGQDGVLARARFGHRPSTPSMTWPAYGSASSAARVYEELAANRPGGHRPDAGRAICLSTKRPMTPSATCRRTALDLVVLDAPAGRGLCRRREASSWSARA